MTTINELKGQYFDALDELRDTMTTIGVDKLPDDLMRSHTPEKLHYKITELSRMAALCAELHTTANAIYSNLETLGYTSQLQRRKRRNNQPAAHSAISVVGKDGRNYVIEVAQFDPDYHTEDAA